MTIAIDFDGTIVTHEYPKIGEELPFATETLKMLIKEHHKLILWTVREGALLDEAVNWCRERGVEFYAINKDYPEERQEWNNHYYGYGKYGKYGHYGRYGRYGKGSYGSYGSYGNYSKSHYGDANDDSVKH